MRIAVDASRAVVARRTGTERYCLELIRGLLRLDPTNEYLLYFNRPPSPGLLPAGANWRARVVPFPRLWTHARLSRELVRDRPDVLFVPAHVLPAWHPARSVVTIHDLGFHFYPWAHRLGSRLYLELSTRWAGRRATVIIAVSRSTSGDLRRVYGIPEERIRVVYEGVDDRFRPIRDGAVVAGVRARYGLGQEPYLLALGTIQPRKNLRGLLQAYRLFLESAEAPPALVLAGGTGWGQIKLEAEIRRLGLAGRVHCTGYIDDEDLPALYSGSMAYLQPSLYEGFGLTVLEAMACGVPVIASNNSSLPEVVGQAGLLVDAHTPRDMAAAITRLAAGPALRAELAAAGRRRAAEFTWERCARETRAVLLEAGAA